MKNYLYPQPHGHQASNNNGSFDDYDSVVGNEFSASVTTGGGGGSKNSDDMDDLSSLGNSQIGSSLSAANSPVRMNLSAAAAASTNHHQWQQQQRVSMTPKSNASSSDSDALCVGDVSMILGSVNGDRIAGGGDVESIGGDSLLIMAPPTNPQSSNWERDAAEWNPKPTHRYDNGTSKYLQLGPLGDELSFGGDNPANIKHPNLSERRNVNTYDDYQDDDDDEDTRVGFLPTSKLGNCLMIGSTVLIIGMLAVAVVAILNMNLAFNQQNGSPRWNIDAAAEGANGTIYTPIVPPTLPPSTLTPATSSPTVTTKEASDATVVPTYVTSPTYSPSEDTYSPTGVLTESPIASINNGSSNSTAAPSKEPTTDEPTVSPSKKPTTDEPTPAPSKEPTTDEPTPSPSKAPTTVEPTATNPTPSPVAAASSPTSSPTKQSLLTTGNQAFEEKDVNFHLVADALWVRQDWRKHFKSLNSGFLIHLGSATPEDDCDEIAYERTATSLSYSPIRAFSLPGNDDYPECPDRDVAREYYKEHLMLINEKNWTSPNRYDVKRDPVRNENFAFVYRRTLFVGLNMLTNENEDRTSRMIKQNLQWLDDNFEPHADKIDAIFMFGYGSLRELPDFTDAIIAKKDEEWKDKFVVYARRSDKSQLNPEFANVKDLVELEIGSGYPFTDVHLDLTSADAPRVGYRYVDGSPTN